MDCQEPTLNGFPPGRWRESLLVDSLSIPLILILIRYISYNWCKVVLARIKIRKILVTSLVLLLLCGIVASEFPELLSLTDNTSNDFTLRKINTERLGALSDAGGPVRIADLNSSVLATTLVHSPLIPFETAPVSSELFILHSVLRT
jgi:hypothetical protein